MEKKLKEIDLKTSYERKNTKNVCRYTGKECCLVAECCGECFSETLYGP